jgi:CO dehydrogenase/acetyl-CoA synthase gamma subunit (corrinoid Fe-S protein)
MIVDSGISKRLDHKEMVIPGFAKPLNREIERLTGWNVNIGPVCCGELPLYFGEDWVTP